MKTPTVTHLADHVLVQELVALLKEDHARTAVLLVYLAEVERRKLYLPAGYPSMYQYCVHALHMSEDVAYKRIRVARAAWRYPALLDAIAGRDLHLAGALLLAPHLTPENVQSLIAAAARQSRAAIEELLAARFPQPDLPTMVRPIAMPAALPIVAVAPDATPQLAPGPVVPSVALDRGASMVPLHSQALPARTTPLSPGRIAWQLTVDQETQDAFEEFKALLGHSLPAGSSMADILKLALQAASAQLKKRKFAVGSKPRGHVRAPKGRAIPDAMSREVYERDGGQCTFVNDGKRCDARGDLELDHVLPVARGGATVILNLRLLCRAHNQYEAERVFGEGFMRGKRAWAAKRAKQTKLTQNVSVPS